MDVACANDDFSTALLSSGRNKLIEDELTNAVCLCHCVNQSNSEAWSEQNAEPDEGAMFKYYSVTVCRGNGKIDPISQQCVSRSLSAGECLPDPSEDTGLLPTWF
jgi:hypothetical protein